MFSFFLNHKPQIVFLFKIFYIVLLGILVYGGYHIVTNSELFLFFYALGVNFGRTAAVLLTLTLLPGITKRFGINNALMIIVRTYRRYIGISVFLFAFTHYSFVRLLALLFGNLPFNIAVNFELFGTTAFYLMFFMFVTSNDLSVKKLGKWWNRIHRIVYVIIWLIFLHTYLQRISIWSIMIGVIALLEVMSLLYAFIKSKNKPHISSPNQPPQNPNPTSVV